MGEAGLSRGIVVVERSAQSSSSVARGRTPSCASCHVKSVARVHSVVRPLVLTPPLPPVRSEENDQESQDDSGSSAPGCCCCCCWCDRPRDDRRRRCCCGLDALNGLREDRDEEPGLPLRGCSARLHTVHKVRFSFVLWWYRERSELSDDTT